MPSGPPELHKKWCEAGPYPGDGNLNAQDYLKRQGYRLRKDWQWDKPTLDHQPTEEEWSALDYLVVEWDFGSIIT